MIWIWFPRSAFDGENLCYTKSIAYISLQVDYTFDSIKD